MLFLLPEAFGTKLQGESAALLPAVEVAAATATTLAGSACSEFASKHTADACGIPAAATHGAAGQVAEIDELVGSNSNQADEPLVPSPAKSFDVGDVLGLLEFPVGDEESAAIQAVSPEAWLQEEHEMRPMPSLETYQASESQCPSGLNAEVDERRARFMAAIAEAEKTQTTAIQPQKAKPYRIPKVRSAAQAMSKAGVPQLLPQTVPEPALNGAANALSMIEQSMEVAKITTTAEAQDPVRSGSPRSDVTKPPGRKVRVARWHE